MPVRTRHCQLCKKEIPQARLEAMPETRLCIDCSKKVGGEFSLEMVPENLSKSGSPQDPQALTMKRDRHPG